VPHHPIDVLLNLWVSPIQVRLGGQKLRCAGREREDEASRCAVQR
jgi:hypothetical protein